VANAKPRLRGPRFIYARQFRTARALVPARLRDGRSLPGRYLQCRPPLIRPARSDAPRLRLLDGRRICPAVPPWDIVKALPASRARLRATRQWIAGRKRPFQGSAEDTFHAYAPR